MYRPVLGRIVMAHFNNELIAYVNTGIDPGMAAERGQLFICTRKRAASRSFVFTEQLQHEWDRR
jgi:hypothetical protein